MLRRWIDEFLVAPLRRAAQEQREHVTNSAGPDWHVAVVLVTAALMLTAQAYVFRSGNLDLALDAIAPVMSTSAHERLVATATAAENAQLAGLMMVPYCMIHFGKPPLETLGAIAAGIVLGFMSLKTRSIWLGAALHIFVAWTMDAAALWRLGRL